MAGNAPATMRENRANVGFNEGPGDNNPWTQELGIGNAAYCMAGATTVPFHNGFRWWDDDQFGQHGSAYCPHKMNVAIRHGEYMADRTSRGTPCDVQPLDLLLYDWNGSGEPDHVEVAIEARDGGGRTHNIGYNTSSGVRDLYRDARYLLGRIRPTSNGGWDWGASLPPPVIIGGRELLEVDGDFGPLTRKALQRALGVDDDGDIGPITKKALQRRVGVEDDGDIGPDTKRALQRRVGATVDGAWGPETTKALQRALNAGTF